MLSVIYSLHSIAKFLYRKFSNVQLSTSNSSSLLPHSYTADFNKEEELDTLYNFIQQYGFGTLIAVHPDSNVPVASHIPFLIDKQTGEYGELIAHVARNNEIYKYLSTNSEVLVIFHGPHGYISPQFYLPSHINVPTWNYANVHVYGKAILDTPSGIPPQDVMNDLINFYEEKYMTTMWNWSDYYTPEALLSQRKSIVGFRIRITRIYGKYKLSQNKTRDIQKQVIHGLKNTNQLDIAAFMENYLEKDD
ncbi:unnamed protein product [Didymodactylos carnosus]|uniref:FMN-binding negative transcriptional regulator n=1 Tax=Didymodactylos carnosus TaxID=1234261 RepID=A0A814J4K2_9BILA|nr:unnamed protein product [Didymodactylos carnosus]CAF1183822.1 unnamed protein product [Didymodactylos carnosus]CAF3803340.1 unnamed protein product [Didymodactylos carnosus]CAF3995042.1 unnamed protein product [Didymodactylos carnosus]